jgi:hypothetical protein
VRKSAQWLVGLAVSVAAFGLAFRGADLARVAEALRTANHFYVLPALGLLYLGLLARAMSWRTILGQPIPFRRVLDALNEGYLLNNVLPFRLGEVARAYLISRGRSLSASQALSSVLVERVVDLCMIVGLLAAFLPLVAGLAWAREAALASVLVTGAALGGLFVLARSRGWVLRLARWGLGYIAWLNTARWEARLGAFIEGMQALQNGRQFFWAATFSALAWLCAGGATSVLLVAFLASPTLTASRLLTMGFFVLVISGLGVALPSAPASAGVFEASVVAALAVFRVEGSLALSYALTFHILHFGLTSVLGGIALAREGISLPRLAQAAQSLVGGAGRVSEPVETSVE